MISTGYNLIEIASDYEKYLMFYLPIEKVSAYNYGDELKFEFEGEKYSAPIKYIDISSTYTPKDMQTLANKNQETVMVKLLIPAECPIASGQEAKVKLT